MKIKDHAIEILGLIIICIMGAIIASNSIHDQNLDKKIDGMTSQLSEINKNIALLQYNVTYLWSRQSRSGEVMYLDYSKVSAQLNQADKNIERLGSKLHVQLIEEPIKVVNPKFTPYNQKRNN